MHNSLVLGQWIISNGRDSGGVMMVMVVMMMVVVFRMICSSSIPGRVEVYLSRVF